MSIASNFPAIKPSLSLDFANTGALDPRITFTRSTTATYYDGVTTAKAEENLLTYSQDINAWSQTAVSVSANSIAAPDGTNTAETITATGGTTPHRVEAAAAAYTGAKTYSIFAKQGTETFIQLSFASDSSGWVNFDLSSGTYSDQGTTVTGAIQNIGNGWYRCIATTSGSTTNLRVSIVSSLSSARIESNALTGNVYLWGAQLEQRSSVTAYTATTTQPITNYIPVLQTAAANVARFDHNPTTGESLGLLIEEARTNLFTYSEQFDNAAWTKSDATVTANAVVAPDGTLSGDKLVPNTNNAVHRMFIGLLGSAGAHTVSAYMKKGEYSWGVLRIEGVNSFFNLGSGTVGTVGAGNTATITDVGNGWYRCTTTRTIAGSTISTIGVASADNTDTFTGDGYSGIYIWGAQLEAGSFATSYIQTVASQVTRAADAASMTGTNFSSWYNAGEGTVYADILGGFSAFAPLFTIDDGSANNRFYAYRNSATPSSSTGIRIDGTSNGLPVLSNYGPSNTGDGKFIFSYAVDNFAAVLNAGTVALDTAGATPVVSKINIGENTPTNRYFGGHIRKIAYYPERLTNAQLQALTS